MPAKLIVSKFRSKCALCGEWIDAGEEVYWDKGVTDPKMRITHTTCPIIEELKSKPIDPYEGQEDKPKATNEDLPF